MATVNLGRVSFVMKGAYSASATYKRQDVVTDGGASYAAKKDVPANTALTNTEYWQKLVETVAGVEIGDTATYATTELLFNPEGTNEHTVPEVNDDSVSEGDTWSSSKINGELSDLKSAFDKDMSYLKVRSKNLLDMNASKWENITSNKDVTLTNPSPDVIRIKSNVLQTYASAATIIDVTGIDTVFARLDSLTTTDGQTRIRLYSYANGTQGTNLGTITRDGKFFNVSQYDFVDVEICASVGTAGTGYSDYGKIMISAGNTIEDYEPYYIYEPKATDALKELNSMKTSIESFNADAIDNVVNLKYRSARTEQGNTIVSLLHFSDIHGDKSNLERIISIKNTMSDYIDDCICTGDIVTSQYTDTSQLFWDNTPGASNIMVALGNHDVWKENSEVFSPENYITQVQAYNRYIAPYVALWNCVFTQDKTYYYKDYQSAKLRLIVLNMMLNGTELSDQLTWLVNTLSSAVTGGYSVVIAEHFAPNAPVVLQSNFSALDGIPSATDSFAVNNDYLSAVDDFITSGGDFVCWLGGHTHCDYVCYNANHQNQMFITITCAKTSTTYSDQNRIRGTKSQDAFNIISFDTVGKIIKITRVGANSDAYLRGRNCLTIRYSDKSIIAQS